MTSYEKRSASNVRRGLALSIPFCYGNPMTTATCSTALIVADVLAILADPDATIRRAWLQERHDAHAAVEVYSATAAKLTDYGDYGTADYYCDLASEAQAQLDAIDARYEGLI